MTTADQIKVMSFGIKILRPDYFRMCIKQKTKYCLEWQTLEKDFKSKAAIDRRMKELLEDKMLIQD